MNTTLYKHLLNHSPNPYVKESGISVTAISHYLHTADEVPFYRNYYPGYQLFYTVSGKGWLDYRGTYQLIEPGTITCINLENPHGMGAVKNHIWEHYWIICSGKLFDYLYRIIFNYSNILELSDSHSVRSSFEALYASKKNNDLYFDLKAASSIFNILMGLLTPEGSVYSTKLKDTGFIHRVIAHIEQNYSRRLTVDELAKESGYSTYHFSRLFKKYTGFSPNDFLIKTRMEKAKELLKTSHDPIDIVAQKCGFNSENYFIRVFKDWESITPGSYRNTSHF